MTEYEMTLKAAQTMVGYKINANKNKELPIFIEDLDPVRVKKTGSHMVGFDPLRNDVHAMMLIRQHRMYVTDYDHSQWRVECRGCRSTNVNLNYAIVEVIAQALDAGIAPRRSNTVE